MRFFVAHLVMILLPFVLFAAPYPVCSDASAVDEVFSHSFDIQTSKGKMPANWAQQLTGADLVEDVPLAKVGMIDTYENNHFAKVESVYQQSSAGGEVVFKLTFDELKNSEFVNSKIAEAKARGELPRFIGLAHSAGNDPEVARSLSFLRAEGVLVLASSGNKADAEVHVNQLAPGIINFGSYSSNGKPDKYSQRSYASAPVGEDVFLEVNGERRLESGTSFSSPQYLAALGQVDQLLPGLSEDEVYELIRQTSLLGKSGLQLNHLRLIETAKKLQPSWPSSRSQIFNENSSAYDLAAEAREVYQAAESAQGSEKLKLLRKSFFLDPTQAHIRRDLIEAYSLTHPALAEYFQSLEYDQTKRPKKDTEQVEAALAQETSSTLAPLKPLGAEPIVSSAVEQASVKQASIESSLGAEDSQIQMALIRILDSEASSNRPSVSLVQAVSKLQTSKNSKTRLLASRVVEKYSPETRVSTSSPGVSFRTESEAESENDLGAFELQTDPFARYLFEASLTSDRDLSAQLIDTYVSYKSEFSERGEAQMQSRIWEDLGQRQESEFWRAGLDSLKRLGVSEKALAEQMATGQVVIPWGLRLEEDL